MDAFRLPPFIHTATHLGYPAYFMTIVGVWYVSAGIVVLAPRLPRLKEWAYAGLIFNYTGAAFSHVWIGDGFEKLVGPVIFIGLTLTSWALRPEPRRAFTPSPLPTAGLSRKRLAAYWIATVLVAAELLVGGVWDLLRIDLVRGVINHLGYPTYLLVIMGVWKLPGAVALLVPSLPRIKEWLTPAQSSRTHRPLPPRDRRRRNRPGRRSDSAPCADVRFVGPALWFGAAMTAAMACDLGAGLGQTPRGGFSPCIS